MTNIINVAAVCCIEIAAAASIRSESERMSSGNPSVRLAHGGEHQGVNDIPKELLRAINMDDSSEHPSDSAGGLGNMPELTLLLEDDEVIKRFSVSQITVNLRTCCCAWVIIYYAPGSLARGIMH